MLRIGMTGGIGSGKSVASELFAALGSPVIDTDRIARKLSLPGEAGHAGILKLFGEAALDDSGAVNRSWLRNTIFDNAADRERLEALLHPLIRHEVVGRLGSLKAPYCLVVVPLLVETGFDDLIERILVVDADESICIQRVMARDGSGETEVRKIMVAQASRVQRLNAADDVIVNNGSIEDLKAQVQRLHTYYLSLARVGTTG